MMKARLAAIAGVIVFTCASLAQAAVVPLKPGPDLAAPGPHTAEGIAPAERDAASAFLARAASSAPRSATQPGVPAAHPFYADVLTAGLLVLDLGAVPDQRAQVPTISAAPLPGALWLFGSAFLAFLGISARRKF